MRFKVKIGQKEFDVEISEVGNEVKIKVNQKEFLFGEKEKIEKIFKAKVKIPKKSFLKREILAPISGQISEIFVKEGEKVKEGQKLFLLSAMKMENEILADREGKVKKILVKKGQKVEKDEILLILE
jgi:biotin carboxyl carrier protein